MTQHKTLAFLFACLVVAACGGDDGSPNKTTNMNDPDGGPMGDPGSGDGDGDGSGDGDMTSEDAQVPSGCDMQTLFAQKCGSSVCHEGEMAQVGLDLVSAGVEERVSGAAAVCGGTLADASDPSASMLYRKVAGLSDCGSPMPLGQAALSESEIECVRGWISGLLPPPPPAKTDMPDMEDKEPPPEATIPHECVMVGQTRACYSGTPNTLGVGMCHNGMQTCIAGAAGSPNTWGACEGDYTGLAENCNTPENEDCDVLTPANSCTPTWSRSYGMTDLSYNGRSVAFDSQGNVYLLGDFEGSGNLGAGPVSAPGGKANVFLSKFDSVGNLLWVKTYGDTSSQFGQKIVVDGNDNPILIVRAFGTVEYWDHTDDPDDDLDGAGETDIHVVKLDGDGKHIWSHVFGGPSADRAEDMAVDADNNVYVTGTFTGVADFKVRTLQSTKHDAEPADRDVFVLKIAEDGTVVFAARYGGAGDDYGRGIGVDASGNIFLAGYFGGSITDGGPATIGFGGSVLTSAGDRDIFVAKLDNVLGHSWSKSFGSDGSDEVQDLVVDSQDNLVVMGYFTGALDFGAGTVTSAGDRDILLLKLDNDGQTLFAKGFGDAADQSFTEIGPEHTWSALALDSADHVYLSTSLNGQARFGDTPVSELLSAGKNDVAVVEFDESGAFVWGRRYGKAGTELALDVAVDGSGLVAMTGRIFGTGIEFASAGEVAGHPSGGTAFIVKLDPDDPGL